MDKAGRLVLALCGAHARHDGFGCSPKGFGQCQCDQDLPGLLVGCECVRPRVRAARTVEEALNMEHGQGKQTSLCVFFF